MPESVAQVEKVTFEEILANSEGCAQDFDCRRSDRPQEVEAGTTFRDDSWALFGCLKDLNCKRGVSTPAP